MKKISMDDFIKNYVLAVPRAEIKIENGKVFSNIYEEKDNKSIKIIKVEVEVESISDFIAQISYKSEDRGKIIGSINLLKSVNTGTIIDEIVKENKEVLL